MHIYSQDRYSQELPIGPYDMMHPQLEHNEKAQSLIVYQSNQIPHLVMADNESALLLFSNHMGRLYTINREQWVIVLLSLGHKIGHRTEMSHQEHGNSLEFEIKKEYIKAQRAGFQRELLSQQTAHLYTLVNKDLPI